MRYGQSLAKPVAAVARTKSLMIQSLATASEVSAGSKGEVKVLLLPKKGVQLAGEGRLPTSITISGPKGFKAEVKSVGELVKGKTTVSVPFSTSADAAKGAASLKVTLRFQASKGKKDLGYQEVSYTLPITIK